MTIFYFEVKHPVIYLPGICTLDKDDKEWQYTMVRLHRIFRFVKEKEFKYSDIKIKISGRVLIFLDYLGRKWYDERIGISTAWRLSKLLAP
jgi:hypothetical protein